MVTLDNPKLGCARCKEPTIPLITTSQSSSIPSRIRLMAVLAIATTAAVFVLLQFRTSTGSKPELVQRWRLPTEEPVVKTNPKVKFVPIRD